MTTVEGPVHRSSRVVLAFDFGLRHIGVAVSSECLVEAVAIGSVSARQGAPDWGAMTALLQAWGPQLFIVGYPLNMNGTKQGMTRKAKRFGRLLQQHYHLPVEYVDERLTTLVAREVVFQREGYKGLKKKDLHAESARLILEQWLAESQEGLDG